MRQKQPFFIDRLKSIQYVLKGIGILLCTERSIMVQIFLSVVLVGMGFYFDINRLEWCLQLLCMGGVLSLEAMNTAIEKTLDFIHPEHHKTVGRLKDIAAGGVGFFALLALIVLVLIYCDKIIF